METARLWEALRTSYWFVPSVLAAAAVAAALGLLELDARRGGEPPIGAWWLYGGSAAGARAVLAAIVSSMISVTSVVFSITIVVLSLASGQFGPRLVRNFMRDRATQLVMGVFIATFIYALIILGAVQGVDGRGFVPRLSVMFGVLLVVASAGFLIFFIHHIALAIQADHVVASISDELRHALDRMYPSGLGRSADDVEADAARPAVDFPHVVEVPAERDGYLQIVDSDRLMETARRHDLVIELEHRPGHWLVRGSTLAILGSRKPIDPSHTAAVGDAVVLARHRSLTQDVEFGFDQLVEVAVRALSPGVNDPFTAMTCIDWLSAHLRDLAGRGFPDRCRYDESGRLRLILHAPSFADFVGSAFDQIRRNARGSVEVLGRLLEGIEKVLEGTDQPHRRAPLERQAQLVILAAEAADLSPHDMADLRKLQAAAATAASPRSGR